MNLSYKFTEAQPGNLFIPFPSHFANSPTIQDLSLTANSVDIHLSVGDVACLFERHPDWTGVILTAHDQFIGIVTRRAFCELLGNLFGKGIFSKVSIFAFFEKYGTGGLILDGSTPIPEAVKTALIRKDDAIHDPIVVRQTGCRYGLLAMPVLLKAQAALLLGDPSGAVQQYSSKVDMNSVHPN